METGFVVALTSILTIIVSKFKFYIKKNGKWTCGCGFTDKPLLDDDDLEVKEFDLGSVKGIYILNLNIFMCHLIMNNKK